MTPEKFRTLAAQIAGPHWKTNLGKMIGKKRTTVWEYANGVRPVPETVQRLMQMMAGDTTTTNSPVEQKERCNG